MLERFSYINHLGESILFGENNIYANLNTLHDFKWDVVSRTDRITGFERKIHTKSFPVRIGALSEEEGMEKRNKLFEIPEKDVLALVPGKLTINGFYLSCYVTSSTKTYYSIEGKFLSCDIVITTDRPFWVREVDPTYETFDDDTYIINPSAFDSNFRMQFDGAVSNPEAIISGHVYKINTSVGSGVQLVIDSMEEKVYSYDPSEEQAYNAFSYRDRSSYIFEKIPAGRSGITKPSSCTITIYEERSEPIWIVAENQQEFANWLYDLTNGHAFEASHVYPRPSSLSFYIDTDGHLIQEKEENSLANYGAIEDGRLVIYHD